MKRKLFFALFYLGLALYLGFLIRKNAAMLAAIPTVAFALLIPYPFLAAAQMALAARANQSLFEGQMERNTLANNMRLSLVNALGNLLPVSVGLLSKGYYAKRTNKLGYPAFVILTAHQLAAGLLWSAVACIAFAAYAHAPRMLIPAAGLLAAAFAPRIDPFRWLPTRFLSWLPQADYQLARKAGWSRFPSQALLQGATQILNSAMLFLIFRAMGVPVSVWQVFLIFTAVNLSRYISFTPGALGIPEGFGSAVSASLGIPFSIAFLAIAVSRILDICMFIFAVPFFFPLKGGHAGANPVVP